MSPFVIALLFFLPQRFRIPTWLMKLWKTLGDHIFGVFLAIACLSSIPFFINGASVGEDIGSQVKSSLQWANGNVPAPNFVKQPNPNDLSSDREVWVLRPPGVSLLPIPGMLMGFSLGASIQIGLLFCGIVGGVGWLFFFERMNLCSSTLLVLSIMLGLLAGNATATFSTGNIILFALVPWFIIWTFKINCSIVGPNFSTQTLLSLLVFLFLLGSFAWIKLSGIIAAGTVGACLFFLLFSKFYADRKFQFLGVFMALGVFFWIPMIGLENTNHHLSGTTSDQLYGGIVSEAESPLTGKHWLKSTRSGWLAWSIMAAPGYALPPKDFANGLRDLGKQFPEFCAWMDSHSINDHVFLAGLVGIIFSCLLFFQIRTVFSFLNNHFKILLLSFLTIPFIGLALLAFRFQWNYLLYHSHTFEFWILFLIPLLFAISRFDNFKIQTNLLFGLCLAFPITKSFELFINAVVMHEGPSIAKTEHFLGLAGSRFSNSIEVIEEDSDNPADVLLFLPSGNMSDLILRTKMRTFATHFAADNFPKMERFSTTKPLSVYCAYDSRLSQNPAFVEALDSRFPQSSSRELIFNKEISVLKIRLSPQESRQQPS